LTAFRTHDRKTAASGFMPEAAFQNFSFINHMLHTK
jgi:hypothetical protein